MRVVYIKFVWGHTLIMQSQFWKKSFDPKTAHFALFTYFYDDQNLYFLTAKIAVSIYSIGLFSFFLK